MNEKIDSTLAGIRISFQKALVLHQAGKNNVEKSLGELSEKLGSIAGIHSELLSYAALLNHDGAKEEREQALPPVRTS